MTCLGVLLAVGCGPQGDDGGTSAPITPPSWDAGWSDPGPGDGGTDAGTSDAGVEPRICEPKAYEACACPSGAQGRRQCITSGADWGACECGTAGTCSSSSLVLAGSLHTSQTELDFTGGSVQVKSIHKKDVDAIEDGCISQFELTLTRPNDECELDLVFDRSANTSNGGLLYVSLMADSKCPGFPDATEGLYVSESGFAPWNFLGPQSVPQRQASTACIAQVALGFPDKPFRLYRSSPSAAELTLNLKDLHLYGRLFSTGDEAERCYTAESCGPSMHDGGDGWCVSESRCSPGYHDSGTGVCVKKGTCAEGYRPNSVGECSAWRATTSLPGPRARLASAVARGFIYVAGGNAQNGTSASSDVWVASIGEGGGLGLWTAVTPLPLPRENHQLVADGSALYVLGGVEGCAADTSCTPKQTSSILRAPVNEDGTLGAWTQAGNMPLALTEFEAVVSHDHLYVLGGRYESSYSGSVVWGNVGRASLSPEGTLGTWAITSLPSSRFGLGAVAAGDFLYIAGGSGSYSSGYTDAVYRAALATDGSVGSWVSQPALPARCSDLAVEAEGGYLYVLGGDCSDVSPQSLRGRTAWHAWSGTSGTVEGWVSDVGFEPGRSGHASVTFNGYVYVLGGSGTEGALDSVQVAPLRATGGFGS